ncbi:MAG: MFS transporter [Chloroflexi bacterium]|nr:MFS transporter [Chloroflexota bacterium]
MDALSGSEEVQAGASPLYALVAARAVSMMGNQFNAIAVPWFVLQTTHSAAKTGITAAITVLPTILSPLFSSNIVDRLGYKYTSVLSDLASGVAVAFIPVLYSLHLLQFWQLLALVFLRAVLDPPGGTARTSMMPDLARMARTSLERANSVTQAINHGTILLGAPSAGVLIAAMGTANVLWLDAASFFISGAIIALAAPVLPIPKKSVSDSDDKSSPGYLADIAAGMRFVTQDPLILAMIVSVLVINLLTEPVISVILPVYARNVFHNPAAFGITVAVMGGGALLGTVLFGIIGHRLPRRMTFLLAFVGVALPFAVMAALPPLPVMLAAFAAGGLASGPINPLISTLLQERVPKSMRARVFSLLSASAGAAIPLGLLIVGYALDWAGIRPTLGVVSGGLALFIIILIANRNLRDMDIRMSVDRVKSSNC